MDARIARELELLRGGGQAVEFFQVGDRGYVVYRDVPTRAEPPKSDVIVPVPSGYPAAMIDLAGLPAGSPLLPRVKGGTNSQGIVTVAGRDWQLASYHPHTNGGAPPWNPALHGFHTYLGELLAWLAVVA